MKSEMNPFPFEFHVTDDPEVYIHLRLRQSTVQWFVDRYGDHWPTHVAELIDNFVREENCGRE